MASATKKLKRNRKQKLHRQGTVRKRKLRAEGTTQTAAALFSDEEQ